MSSYTKEDIMQSAKEHNIRFVRLQFSDILGVLKNVAIPTGQLEKALDGEIMFDGSSVEGFTRIEESDMYLKPDFSSWQIYPDMVVTGVARLICDIYGSDNTPFKGDPRYVLKKTIEEARNMGFDEMNVGPEAEFYLFNTKSNGEPTLTTHDNAGYFDLSPVDLGENARRDMVLALEDIGYEIEASHHEVGPGQHEIDFKYGSAIKTADDIQTFKLMVRTIAQNHGLHATFMAKPIFGIAGSGMHMNQSLTKNGANAFYDPNGVDGLSEVAYYYIGGLMKHAKAISAIANPTVNSYKRLVSGYEAPVYIAWSGQNRSPLIRIPAKRGMSTRIEMRSPDPSCNPYLATAVMLAAGLDGIKNRIMPPAACDYNLYDLTQAEIKDRGIECLPDNLIAALNELKQDDVIKNALGNHVFECYVRAKELEWDSYRTFISEWEIKEYLTKF